MMTDTEARTVVLGRRDYGHGVEANVVVIDGEEFAEFRGAYFSPCGFCSPQWSGTKTHHLGVYGGVCFQCNGRGYHRRYESRAKVEALVKRRKSDRARAERKREAAEQAKAAEAAAWEQAHPDEAAVLANLRAMADEQGAEAVEARWGAFLWSLALQAGYRPLSEAQTVHVLPAVEKVAAREAAAAVKAAGQRHYDGKKVTAAAGVVTVAMNVAGYMPGSSSRLVVIEATGEHEGITFKMIGTGESLWGTRRGDEVEVTGTVKAYEHYEGTPQTVLTRAKVVVTREAEGDDA